MSAVVPSEYIPMAEKCSVIPTERLAGTNGIIIMEDNEDNDIKVTGGPVIPESDAVIVVVPAAKPVAIPLENIVAVVRMELPQLTCVVRSAVKPFE